MIRYIEGEYLYYDKGAIVVKTAGGIGFRINVPDTSELLLSREGETVCAYTHMQVKEDDISLYGFSDSESLTLYEQLISVNGVGPKAGMSIMSLGTPNAIKSYILQKDAGMISKAQGIGKKTAERVILELSDKVVALPSDISGDTPVRPAALSTERNDAIVALTTLGYSKSEAEAAIGSVPDECLTAEQYIRSALKYLL